MNTKHKTTKRHKQPLQKRKKNNSKLDKLTKEVKKVEQIVKKTKIPKIHSSEMVKVEKNARESNNYLAALKYDKGVQFPHFPLHNASPFHIAKRQGITTTQVNANGLAFIEISPSLFGNISIANSTSPILQIAQAYRDWETDRKSVV